MKTSALVVGAGPAGLAAAARLSAWCEVQVIDQAPKTKLSQIGEHLPPAGLSALAQLGLGALLDDTAHFECHGVISTWGSDAPAERDYVFAPGGHGLNLDRARFSADFIAHCKAAGVRFSFGTSLTRLAPSNPGFKAELRSSDGTRRARFDLVIDASGRSARAARLLGGTVEHDDPMVCLIGRAEGLSSHLLRIEAVEAGWWYDAALPDGARVCALMTDPGLPGENGMTPKDFWHTEIAKRQGALSLPGADVTACAAGTQHTAGPDLPGFAAVGDASIAFDPLSSWGIAKAIKDGFDAAEALEAAHAGDRSALPRRRAAQRAAFLAHRTKRAEYYNAEQRWPDAPFWQARHRACRTDFNKGDQRCAS